MPVRYSPAVEAAMTEVCPPRDAFDAADFDPVEYLNSRFPDEGSLTALPAFVEEASDRLRRAENDLLKAVEQQATHATSAENDLKGAKSAVAQLYTRVSDIKKEASESEETVKELCQHIRELDIAKTNLTSSINTLRSVQLWMLQLQVLSSSFEKRRFLQTRDALQEAIKYSSMFSHMTTMPKVRELNNQQTQLCRQIEYYIRNNTFGDISLESMDENVMAEACAIVDLMEEESRKRLRDRFIEKVLESYSLRFKRGTEDAKLERTERRYVFIRTLLEHYESFFKNVFPRHWCVPQELCVSFCLRTKQELDYQLHDASGDIDVVVLTYIIQKTIDSERELTQLMAWGDEFPGRRELPVYRYNGMILSAFKEHMGLLTQNEDRMMSEALLQPLIGSGDAVCPGWYSSEEEVRQGTTLPIAEDVFVFIKESLKRALRIGQADVLLDMAGVWRRHLVQLSDSVIGLLPNPAVTTIDIRRACILLNTADLCQSTSSDLGEEVCARSEAPPREVAFSEVTDAFSSVYSKAIQSLLHGLEHSLGSLLLDYGSGGFMVKSTGFDTGAADESKLLRSMVTVLHDTILSCASIISNSALRFLLDKIAASVIPQYGNTLYRLRRLPDDGVGVMRIDAAAFEKVFLQLPNYNDPNRFSASALSGYMRLVRKEFDQLNRALKVLQVNARADAFVDVYYEVVLPEDRSIHNFVRLVELKGLKREDVRTSVATLSKRGVAEATKRDFQREAELGIATGVSPVGIDGNTGGTGGGTSSTLNFASLFSAVGVGGVNSSATLAPIGAVSNVGTPLPTRSGVDSSSGVASSSPFSLSNLVSSIGSGGGARTTTAAVPSHSPSSPQVSPSAFDGVGGAAGCSSINGVTQHDHSLGSRFATAARNTATSMNFLNKLKKSDTKPSS